ncbi:MAG: C39 family peptidase [bacterium]
MNVKFIIIGLIILSSGPTLAAGAGSSIWGLTEESFVTTSWNDEGLWLVDADSREISQIDVEGIRGRYLDFDGERICAKIISSEGQVPVVHDVISGETVFLTNPSTSASSPVFVGKNIACADKDCLTLYDNEGYALRSFPIGDMPHGFDFCDNLIMWASADGEVHSFDVATGQISKLPAPTSLWKAKFIHDQLYAEGSDGFVWKSTSRGWEKVCEGSNPQAYLNGIIVTSTISDGMKIIESDIFMFNNGIETHIDDGGILITNASVSPDGNHIAFSNYTDGGLYIAEINGFALRNIELIAPADYFNVETPPRPRPAEPMLNNYAPYLHQVYDTPDDFNGNWSCGPSSCMMAQGKYEILPHHDITCSSPYSHTSHWGWYINNEYSFNGYTYDILGLAAGSVWVPGAHGFICREYGGAVWAYMSNWLSQHTLSSVIDTTPTWSEYTAEIDDGYVVVASNQIRGLGHIILFKGYNADHSFYVNDPWGDANTPDYFCYDGADAILDWPGYDNGHVQPDVRGIITARGSPLGAADTIVDDQTSGFERFGSSSFWWDDDIGWETHMWFTYSTNAADTANDTCYTTWTPLLPDRRYYEVFAYIPNNHAVASAKYRVYHDLGMTQSIVRQADYFNEWVSLGTFMCEANAGSWVYLGDGTGYSGEKIGFDAIKWSDRGPLPAPDTLVGLFSDGFRWGGPIKWRRIVSGGTEGTFYWTGSITSTPDVNSGTWTPNLPEAGEYDVYAYIPSTNATANAIYSIHHSSGSANVTINQSSYSDEWVLLGRYSFSAGSSSYVYLGDSTGASGTSIGYDALVWRYVGLNIAETSLPDDFAMTTFPNPFNSAVSLHFHGISTREKIRIRIHDILGKLVAHETLTDGQRDYIWRPSEDLGAGVYFVRAECDGHYTDTKIMFIK